MTTRKGAGPVLMIGNAHIDPVWLWTRSEGRTVTLNTFRTVVALLDEYPEMRFTSAQAQLYAWVEEDDPDLFERIKELVASGRWEIAGGMWVQPDCNLPGGEGFARQLLYGQRYFQSRFGQVASVGYNVDSFGHAGTLPQLLRGAGIDCYVFFRPDPRQEVALDEDLFWWQAPNGSRVLACRPPNHYCTWAGEIESWIVSAVVHAPERAGGVLCFYGVGDHGGGPTRDNLGSIRLVAARADLPEIRHGTVREFFDRAAQTRVDLGARRNDLQHHAPGCYSAHSDIKRWNRRAEHKLVAAEKATAVAGVLSGGPTAGTMAFEEAWRLVLFNQFHDILAGSSIVEAYDDAREDHAEVDRLAEGVSQAALRRLASITDCSGPGKPVILFNPSSWDRRELVLLPAEGDAAAVAGEPVSTQRAANGDLLVDVDLPALGSVCLHLSDALVTNPPSSRPTVGDGVLENEFWRLEVDARTGDWVSLRDKEAGVELLSEPANALVVMDDPSDTWSHGISGYHVAVGRFADATVESLEAGPLRASLRIRRRHGRSSVEETVSLAAGDRAIAVTSRIDWHDTRKALKLSFPVALDYPVCTYEAPYGVTERVPNGHEEPGQTWVDATGVAHDADGRPVPYGLALVNDSKYAYDIKGRAPARGRERADVEMRLTILRSPPYAFHDPRPYDPRESYRFIDQGEQVVRYWLLPHRGGWQEAEVPRRAHALNTPILVHSAVAGQGGLPARWSFLRCDTPHVEVAVLKQAEEGRGLVLRLWETGGHDRDANLVFPLWGTELAVPLGHHQVNTLLISAHDGTVEAAEVDLLERPAAATGRSTAKSAAPGAEQR